jgi:hypothetical protein
VNSLFKPQMCQRLLGCLIGMDRCSACNVGWRSTFHDEHVTQQFCEESFTIARIPDILGPANPHRFTSERLNGI